MYGPLALRPALCSLGAARWPSDIVTNLTARDCAIGGITGTDFCTKLITQTGVALVPGAAFGDDRWVRLSYAAATSDLTRALDRIVEFAKKLGD